MSDNKTCNKCLTAKPFIDFGREKCKKDGLKTICKECRGGARSQDSLSIRYEQGDSKVDICKCGKFYINEVFHGGFYSGEWHLLDQCLKCSPILISNESLFEKNNRLEDEIDRLKKIIEKYKECVEYIIDNDDDCYLMSEKAKQCLKETEELSSVIKTEAVL